MYQINGESHILNCLGQAPSDEQEAMLRWLPRLAADPVGVASAVLRPHGVPAYTAGVPGSNAFVDYLVAEQYKTVLILGVETVRPQGD